MKKVRFDLWLLRADGTVTILEACKKYKRLKQVVAERSTLDGDRFLIIPTCPFAYCPVVARNSCEAPPPSARPQPQESC